MERPNHPSQLKEHGEKVPAEERSKIEASINNLRETLKGDDTDAIKKAQETLMQDAQTIGKIVYEEMAKQQSGEGATAAAGAPKAGTIPVPPRVHGGLIGTFIATLVLALEVLVSLVTGTLRFIVRGFGKAGDSILRSTGSVVGRLFRLMLMLFFLSLCYGLS